jgi:hypothetical protein
MIIRINKNNHLALVRCWDFAKGHVVELRPEPEPLDQPFLPRLAILRFLGGVAVLVAVGGAVGKRLITKKN